VVKNLIKKGILYLYFNIYDKRVKLWIEAERLRRVRLTLKSAGCSFSIKSPYKFYNPQYVIIGNNFNASDRLKIEAIDDYNGQKFTPEILIGNNVTVISNCHIGCIDQISIGNNVLIASNVYISDHSHGEISAEALNKSPIERNLVSKGPVNIGDNVWIGENVAILPGVTIGSNSIIGANSVVTGSIDANTVAAGNPAKLIKLLR